MEDITPLLRNSNIFADLSQESMDRIASRFEKTSYQAEEMVFREGEPGDRMFIVTRGRVAVLKDMGWGQRELKRMEPGEMFGEMALILREKRTASIKALEPTECLALGEEDFIDLLNTDAAFAQKVLRVLTNRLKRTDELGTEEVLNAHKAMIFSLANLADSRDPETGAHLQRVRNYCALLSEKISTEPKFQKAIYPGFTESIFFVSPLHDIGKVGIPDRVLLKPGKLDEDEYEIMKTHTVRGAETLKDMAEQCEQETFRMAVRIIRHHHERWDGKGYPDGMAGEAIPLEARIMAMADVYDALLSKRVYKAPFTYEKTASILQEGLGSQFDPHVGKVMMKHMDGFEEIHKKFQEG